MFITMKFLIVQAEDIREEPQYPKSIHSEAELEDKVVPEDSKLQTEKRAELSEHENIYERKNLLFTFQKKI